MNLSIRPRGDAAVVDIEGEVDLKGSPVLRKAVFDVLRKYPVVALSLAQIRYIDSSGIAVLIEALRESQKAGRRFVLFGMNQEVQDVFKLTHVVRIFEIAETEEQALQPGTQK
jgi:anti-sigma B factor antagonist